MPIDYSKYPPNWKSEIRPRILARANNRCERCGAVNYSVGYMKDGKFWTFAKPPYSHPGKISEYKAAREMIDHLNNWCNMEEKYIVIVLTIAHLDHDEENHEVSDDRLQALCQRCHLKYDAKEKARRKKHKQLKNQLYLWQQ